MMRINTNLASISAQRALGNTTRDLERSLKSLASGTRFSDAGADPSGYAIAQNVDAQIRGYRSARYAADNAVSFVQMGEAGLNEQGNILIRLRELAVQAASDSLGDQEREFLSYETEQLKEEFERIAQSTKYGSQPLLNGDTKEYEFQVGIQSGKENIIKYEHDTDSTASNLGVDGIDIADQDSARDALDTIDEALVEINRGRAKMGAIQNRMDTAVNHIDGQIEQLSAAYGRLADADVPTAVSNMKQAQILQQYQAATLAVANESKGYLLKLIV